jgi:hypothetical protein
MEQTSQRDRSLLERATHELDSLRCSSLSSTCRQSQLLHSAFPAACREILWSIPGNSNCIDCGQPNPEWASVSFGTLLCISCSGRHRSYGVQTSVVRSIHMDSWTHTQVLNMLEGGNEQLRGFFERHQMQIGPARSRRYQTKAASFYRTQLAAHVERVARMGRYQGRSATRNQVRRRSKSIRSSSTAAATRNSNAASAGVSTGTPTASGKQQLCRRESERRDEQARKSSQQTINAV